MRQQLIDLYEIQKIDIEIRDVERSRDAIPARLQALATTLEEQRGALTSLEAQREQASTEIRTLEGQVHAENDKIRKWEKRLNDIRNQREYVALSREIEGSKRANRNTEETILELMTKRDEFQKSIDELGEKIAADELDHESEQADVDQKLTAIDDDLAGKSSRRDSLCPNVKPTLLRKYEAIRNKRLGIGLVTAEDGSCTGCNMRLPPQLYNILQRGDSLEQCPSCQRIVVFAGLLVNGEPAVATAAAPVANA